MTHKIRCGNCRHYLGEAAVELCFVEHIDGGAKARVRPPRDLRYCKSCRRLNVYVMKGELLDALDRRGTKGVMSGDS